MSDEQEGLALEEQEMIEPGAEEEEAEEPDPLAEAQERIAALEESERGLKGALSEARSEGRRYRDGYDSLYRTIAGAQQGRQEEEPEPAPDPAENPAGFVQHTVREQVGEIREELREQNKQTALREQAQAALNQVDRAVSDGGEELSGMMKFLDEKARQNAELSGQPAAANPQMTRIGLAVYAQRSGISIPEAIQRYASLYGYQPPKPKGETDVKTNAKPAASRSLSGARGTPTSSRPSKRVLDMSVEELDAYHQQLTSKLGSTYAADQQIAKESGQPGA